MSKMRITLALEYEGEFTPEIIKTRLHEALRDGEIGISFDVLAITTLPPLSNVVAERTTS